MAHAGYQVKFCGGELGGQGLAMGGREQGVGRAVDDLGRGLDPGERGLAVGGHGTAGSVVVEGGRVVAGAAAGLFDEVTGRRFVERPDGTVEDAPGFQVGGQAVIGVVGGELAIFITWARNSRAGGGRSDGSGAWPDRARAQAGPALWPMGEVIRAVSVRTRPGWWTARSWAMRPPRDAPTM